MPANSLSHLAHVRWPMPMLYVPAGQADIDNANDALHE